MIKLPEKFSPFFSDNLKKDPRSQQEAERGLKTENGRVEAPSPTRKLTSSTLEKIQAMEANGENSLRT